MARRQNRTETAGAPGPGTRLPAWLFALALAVATLLVYLPAREHGYVAYDDPEYVTDNAVVRAGLTGEGIAWAFTTGHASNWHPLTWLSHMLDVELSGPGPAGAHLTNVALHVANTVLLFGAILLLSPGAAGRAAWVASLFALHPLHVESVAWVAERKDLLSGFFFLLTLGAYAVWVWKRETGRNAGAPAGAWYAAALGFFLLGLLSKPMLVTLPCVLLLLDHWPLRRLSLASWREFAGGLGPRLREKTPFFLLSVASCVVTFLVQQRGGAVQSLESFTVGERVANALVAYVLYLRNAVWPAGLAVFYPHPGTWPAAWVLGAAGLLAALSLLALRAARIQPFVTTGWFWFLGMLVPVIGLVQVGNQALADRYTYLPLIGIFIAVAWGAAELAARRSWPKAALAAVAALPVLACALLTRAQLGHWRDSEALFRHTLAVTENNHVVHNNLGALLFERGEAEAAARHHRTALGIDPGYADAHGNLGNALLAQGQVDEALAHYETALELRPRDADAYVNHGNALVRKQRLPDAIARYRKALELQPRHAKAHYNLALCLLETGAMDEGIAHLRLAVAFRPDYLRAHENLGRALAMQGRLEEAQRCFQRALEIDPAHASVQAELGELQRRLQAARPSSLESPQASSRL